VTRLRWPVSLLTWPNTVVARRASPTPAPT
jgi:hypothetical protein